MEELILSEFYNKILIEATGGVIDIDGFKFNIEFQTRNGSSRYLNENVFETLEIKNKELLNYMKVNMEQFALNLSTNLNAATDDIRDNIDTLRSRD